MEADTASMLTEVHLIYYIIGEHSLHADRGAASDGAAVVWICRVTVAWICRVAVAWICRVAALWIEYCSVP
jgi:hypothetical protein